MSLQITTGTTDGSLTAFAEALRSYELAHPLAQIDLYRLDEHSIRVRIIDPDFEGKPLAWRHQHTWTYLDALDDSTQSELSSLTLLTPAERGTSLSSMRFDEGQHPQPMA